MQPVITQAEHSHHLSAHSLILKQHLSPQLSWNHTEPRGLSRFIIASAEERARRRKVQFGFSAKLQKSMKCVCMFLSASGDVEVGLQGPRKLGEPTRSASEKVRFSEITDGEYFFSFHICH